MEKHICVPVPKFLEGYEITGVVVVSDTGCFFFIRYYVKDAHPELRHSAPVKFVNGFYSGLPETEVTWSGICPTATFTVFPNLAVAA